MFHDRIIIQTMLNGKLLYMKMTNCPFSFIVYLKFGK